MLGLPKRRTKRSIQSMLSVSGVPLGVVTANTTDSAPLSALMAPTPPPLSPPPGAPPPPGAALALGGARARRGRARRLVPADAHPARVRFGLGPGAAHRVAQAVRAVDKLGRGLALHAHRLAGGGRSVGPHRHQHVALHLVERAAARTAERA